MKPMTVNAFVEARVQPELRPIVRKIRKLMREYGPRVQETMSYGIPSYRATRIIALISPTKKDITLAFSRGAAMDDKYGLLRGVGHKSKNLKFRNAGEVDETVLRYYVRQALALDEEQGA